ncbi:MAG: T9SS type A sorting domain-containing protein, partial [Bacteroidota bacterium]
MKRHASTSLGALALGTAALVAAPEAEAQVTFAEANPSPFDQFDGIQDSAIELADFDGDGDFDLLYTNKYATLEVYKNVGTPEEAVFKLVTDQESLAEFLPTDLTVPPRLADLDADGDLDVVTVDRAGVLRYFENVGTPTKPRVVERTGDESPVSGIANLKDVEFADLDGDDDIDLIGVDGSLSGPRYFENAGTPGAPVFEERTGSASPLPSFDELIAEPVFIEGVVFADGDDDGDLDLVVGLNSDFYGTRPVRTYRNVGTPTAPNFRQVPADRDPLAVVDDVSLFTRVIPQLVDLDADGDLDFVFGYAYGIELFENVTPASAHGANARFEAVSVPLPAATRDADGALLAWTHTGPAATYEVHRLLGSAGAFDLLGTLSATDGEAVRFHTGPLGDGVSEVRLRRVEADGRSAYGPSAEVRTGLAGTHELGEVYPNPTAAGAQFTLRVAEAQEVRVRVYDAAGRHVADAFSGRVEAGVAERVEVGRGLSAGVYFVRVAGETF